MTTANWGDLLESHLLGIFKQLPLVDLVAGCSQVSRAWHRTLLNHGGSILLASTGIVAVPPPTTLPWPRAMALALAAQYCPLERMTWAADPAILLAAATKDPFKLLHFTLPPCDASASDLWSLLGQLRSESAVSVLSQIVLRSIAEGDYGAFLRIASDFARTAGTRGFSYYDSRGTPIPSACSGPDGVPWGHWALFWGRRGFTDVEKMQPLLVWSLPLLLCPDEELFMTYVRTAVTYSHQEAGRAGRRNLPVNRLVGPFLKVTEPAFIHAAMDLPDPPALLMRLGEVADLLGTIREHIADWETLNMALIVATSIVERILLERLGDTIPYDQEPLLPRLPDADWPEGDGWEGWGEEDEDA
jgi:hypothetical protein